VELAQTYFQRWNCQGNCIRDWLIPLNLDTNHGYAKEQVVNSELVKRQVVLKGRVQRLEHLARASRARLIFLRDQYFGESYQHASWQRLLPFFKLGGWITTTTSEVQLDVCAFNNRALVRDLEEVCRNVNASGATLPDGGRLVVSVGERLRTHALNAPLALTG
jgi:hypothetical protein